MSCLIIERDCHDFLAPHCRIVICRPGVWASLSVVTRDRCVRAGSSLCVGSVTSISALCCSWRKRGWCAGVVCVGLVHACRANNAASVTLGRRRLNYRCERCARLLAWPLLRFAFLLTLSQTLSHWRLSHFIIPDFSFSFRLYFPWIFTARNNDCTLFSVKIFTEDKH